MRIKILLLTLLGGFLPFLHAQVTLPPSGGNQKAEVAQWMGLVEVRVTYNSPDVHDPKGMDRTGHIWGELVPFGLANLNFGNSTAENPSPWRAGANENTVFQCSHDILVEGNKLPAGKYGLHMIPGESDWTVIFNREYSAWGSYFYDEKKDVLRVTVRPESSNYTEWLTYGFTDRLLDECTLNLEWENLRLPIHLSVENIHELYVESLQKELQGQAGFNYLNYVSAVNYCVQVNTHLELALKWAEKAINEPFVGQKNFTTLTTKANVLLAMGRSKEATKIYMNAIDLPDAQVFAIHNLGRQLIQMGDPDLALEIFKANAKRFPDQWPVNVGLMRGYSAKGNYEKALKYAEAALKNVPEGDLLNLENIRSSIQRLKQNQDIN